MFAHSYSEDSHERASVNSVNGDEMTWQSSSLRSGAAR